VFCKDNLVCWECGKRINSLNYLRKDVIVVGECFMKLEGLVRENISIKVFPSCISYYDPCGSWYCPRALCLSCLVRHKVLTEPPGDAQRHLRLPLNPRANR